MTICVHPTHVVAHKHEGGILYLYLMPVVHDESASCEEAELDARDAAFRRGGCL